MAVMVGMAVMVVWDYVVCQSAFHINYLLEIQDSVKKLQNPSANLKGADGPLRGGGGNPSFHPPLYEPLMGM